ncbi:MAG TPA: GTPase HflX [Candidatus Obscuribacterales bacterium]
MFETKPPAEKAILVGILSQGAPEWEVTYSLDELASLADTAGIQTLDTCWQTRSTPNPATFIGRGKVEEVRALAEELDADVVIFDTELSPAQIKNLEKAMNIQVMDRSDVILLIFSERAKTHESKLQVELAQLKYFLPRMKRLWTHLERQAGGLGMRGGMGEKQIEIDRRIVQKKIAKYEADLKEIEKQRHRRNSWRREMFSVALIGYTNVGKSTLFNRLTDANVLVEDRLFATLDSTVRQMHLRDQKFLLTDTVGFVRKLPHHLVASFRSTLEEAREADVLLHVVDITSPVLGEQLEAVDDVLEQLEIQNKPTIYVLNKMDQLDHEPELWKYIPEDAPYVTISAKTGEHVDMLEELILETFINQFQETTIVLPMSEQRWISQVYELGEIREEDYLEGNRIKLRCYAPRRDIERFRKNWQAYQQSLAEVG